MPFIQAALLLKAMGVRPSYANPPAALISTYQGGLSRGALDLKPEAPSLIRPHRDPSAGTALDV